MYKSIWTAHLTTEDEKKRFLNQLYGSRDVIERLRDLVETKEKELGSAERNITAYDNPNWAFQQAHRNGYSNAMSIIKNLINLDHQKNEHTRQ